jgi:hypothetical protein
MKKELTVNTRWEYYVANIAGLTALVVVIGWCGYVALGAQELTPTSYSLWLCILSFIILPFAIISFFSSMKAVVATQKGLVITYVFQKHQNVIAFSEVKDFRSSRKHNEKVVGPAGLTDTFSLTLTDGRVFSFSRSQFDQYSKLKAMVYQAVKR